ncbi:Biopolymer transport protein ExbD/TolR [Gloeocapsa sp. PCC 7428]|uniref:ExbD/TolR family protein n=1 Tax=Gloeocapsa sp. PCC 7428 TaxID=1173026 RepID=UPI0002A61D99|nr:biopolymer transporter ExbD [Gloeocapsa sp. PCC 7428]AFZ29490.1 Biopolymer transport protein ExbD/TolR [Gloeocapsa sp. PCC 7428]
MKINLHSPIEEVQVQIIPLIDVIFCILTFFLLAALQFTRQQAINVDLPRATTGTPPEIRQTLIVTLDAIGQTYVEQEPVSRDQLTQRLQTYRQANPEGIMVLNASRTASYNEVIQVLDLLRAVGGDRVALATLPGDNNPGVSPTVPVVPGVVPSPGTTPTIPQNNLNAPIPTIPSVPAPNQSPISPTTPAVP